MRLSRVPFLAIILAVPACATGGAPPAAPPPDPTEALKELGEVYKYRASQQAAAPAKLADLGEQQAVMENAWPLIESGAIAVVWNAGYSPNSKDVLAYPKDAPAAGGPVLLRNGTVKLMTAGEFAAAKR